MCPVHSSSMWGFPVGCVPCVWKGENIPDWGSGREAAAIPAEMWGASGSVVLGWGSQLVHGLVSDQRE